HLREQNRGLALDSFRLVHRLVPEAPPLDPARYPPEVVKAFDAARKAPGGTARLEVSSAFDGVAVFLDGERIGDTPLAREIAAGPHYLVATEPGFAGRGSRIDAVPGDRVALDLDLARLSRVERALGARMRAVAAGDRASLRRAARSVAVVAGVDAVFVIGSGEGGALTAAVYDRVGDRMSVARPVDRDLGKLLGLVLPAPAPGPADLLLDLQPSGPVAWYQKPWGVLSIGGAVVLTVVGVVALTSLSEPAPLDRNGVFDPFGGM
ncbi:MAG TPA: PEGA domain-containing protein, partial [Kofleriaceae bacterium]|nr:PEGA domain-containing protein [Kofleriaceae bacterium]